MGNFKENFGNFLETVRVVIGQESVRVGMWSDWVFFFRKKVPAKGLDPASQSLLNAKFILEIKIFRIKSSCPKIAPSFNRSNDNSDWRTSGNRSNFGPVSLTFDFLFELCFGKELSI